MLGIVSISVWKQQTSKWNGCIAERGLDDPQTRYSRRPRYRGLSCVYLLLCYRWRTHPPAFWYTNQFELPCCKEKTRSTVIMFAKETFRLLFTMLIVTLSFTNGFIIIKISDDLPSYLLQSSSTYQRWRQCVSIVGEYSQENSPASKCKDNVIACVRGIRKFSWPTPTANHCRYEEKI